MANQLQVDDQVSANVDDEEILNADSESDEASSENGAFGFLSSRGMIKIEEDKIEYGIVENNFFMGMGPLAKDTTIVAVHKNMISSLTGKARLASFRIFSAAVANKNGGNANIRYAWYAGSREKISEILSHGFSGLIKPLDDAQSYGVGIHLAPAKFALDGALSSEIDDGGLKHLLLCRVILGKSEVIPSGSKQFHPSSKEFDSGVDNLSEPRKYVVWFASMNSHICPVFVVSFKGPSSNDLSNIQKNPIKPTSPWMSLPDLMSALSKLLEPWKMVLIAKSHTEFRENKISREQLIKTVRQIAGDKLLFAVIRQCRNKQFRNKNLITATNSGNSSK